MILLITCADVALSILGAYLIPLSMFNTLIKMLLTPLSRSQVSHSRESQQIFRGRLFEVNVFFLYWVGTC